jgi:hypothetical protein
VPTLPSLLLGVSRRFGAAACVQSITSPNEGFILCALILRAYAKNVNMHFFSDFKLKGDQAYQDLIYPRLLLEGWKPFCAVSSVVPKIYLHGKMGIVCLSNPYS